MVETILQKIPIEMMERIKRRRGNTVETVDFGSDPPNEKTLIKLHRQVGKLIAYQYNNCTEFCRDIKHVTFSIRIYFITDYPQHPCSHKPNTLKVS